MDDYYELLGIDHDAPVDDIRSAYRDRKAAVDTSKNDDAKSDVAALNKAWNVLSDPYQRGRYDQQRADSNGTDDSDGDDSDDDAAPVSRRNSASTKSTNSKSTNSKNDRAERRRNARQPAKPTITLPAGVHFPLTKQRLIALMIDLGVMFVIFLVATLIVTPAVDKAVHKPIVDQINSTRKTYNTATTESNKLDKAESTAKSNASNIAKRDGAKSTEAVNATAAYNTAKAAATHYSDHTLKDATTAYDDASKKLVPLDDAIAAGALLVALAYLVVPSISNGQTPGKRSQGIKVIRTDGSPLGFAWAVRRYGLILMITYVLMYVTPFGALGAALVLFGVTTWTRNPNQQGWHDRLVKTVVVADDVA
jgi:hypothetical protein